MARQLNDGRWIGILLTMFNDQWPSPKGGTLIEIGVGRCIIVCV